MGNNGSRTGNITQRQPLEPEQQWAHSFPRNPPRTYQHKVLPERELNKKLRPTNNGDILHAGGTLSGRHQQTLSLEREDKSFRIFRTNSISSNPSDEYNHEEKSQNRSYLPRHRGVHRYAAQRYENKNMHKEKMKKFGSEPDLRDPNALLDHHDVRDKFKGKKKYKAPPPPTIPTSSMLEKTNVNCYQWDEDSSGANEPMLRRGRLFKTKAELKKKCSSPIKSNNQSLGHESTLDCRIKSEKQLHEVKHNILSEQNKLGILSDIEIRDYNRKQEFRYNRLSLPEMHRANSVPEFQAELKEAIQRIKSTKLEPIEASKRNNFSYKYEKKSSKLEKDAKEKLKTLDHNINKRDNIRSRMKQVELETVNEKDNTFDSFENDRGQPSGKESTPEKTTPQITEHGKKEQPSKLFYFGMNEAVHENPIEKPNYADKAVVDHFAATLQPYNHTFPLPNSSGSDISSELEMDESQVSSSGIALQLRPILPKKQLEIPRFSPAAAWKLLSAVESNFAPSTAASDEGPILMEDRIEKLSRPPPPPAVQAGPRSSYDKSGDSGISGDAGPAGFDDSPEGIVDVRNNLPLPLVLNRSQAVSWTPQQDLGEEESSTDEELQNHHNRMHRSITPVKFTPKPNVFSLSLPRDNHLSSYISSKNNGSYAGLQKLKRSVSGVLGNLANKRDSLQSNSFKEQSENWFLSKSAPNSLNNGFNSLEIQNSQKSEEIEQPVTLVGGTNNTQNVTRVMYLPEFDSLYVKKQNSQKKQERAKNKELFRERSRSAERTKENFKLMFMSKSCENISTQVQSSPEPEDLQDPPKHQEDRLKIHKPKRFTFQSTIRQIERRRLAERLSKEAERKEKQRLGELEAMQRVEEEFQRKRAREKASIRQQLRLFSLDETTWSSLPPNLEIKDEVLTRSEPDGAVSSSTSSPILPSEKSKRDSEEVLRRKLTPASDSSEENLRKAPMTQVLSEYRQPQREYKDFRGSPRYRGEFGDSHFVKQTTVHPQVTYNMPKASGHQAETEGSSNYRKQFAHGVKTSRSGDSTYSDDSQPNNRNYSPKIYRSKKGPVSRF